MSKIFYAVLILNLLLMLIYIKLYNVSLVYYYVCVRKLPFKSVFILFIFVFWGCVSTGRVVLEVSLIWLNCITSDEQVY